jgi:ABC-type polysaccharide/polyol phosphate export permease
VVLNEAPEAGWLLYSAAVSLLVFAGGWWLFQKLEPAFADRV